MSAVTSRGDPCHVIAHHSQTAARQMVFTNHIPRSSYCKVISVARNGSLKYKELGRAFTSEELNLLLSPRLNPPELNAARIFLPTMAERICA